MAVRVRIEGRVQGVGFRAWTKREAVSLGLDGWVRNRRDGTVEAIFSGEEAAVRRMVSICHKGPPLSHVTALIEKPADEPDDSGFQTLPTAG